MDKIKRLFVWIFTLIGLILMIIGSVQIINLGLKTYIFPKADSNYCYSPPSPVDGKPLPDDGYLKQCRDQQDAQKQRDASQALALLITGTPVFTYFLRRTKQD